MQVTGIVVGGLHMNAVIWVVVMVHNLFVHHQMRQPLRLFCHQVRRDPRQRLPQHDSDEDEGLAGTEHAESIGVLGWVAPWQWFLVIKFV